MDWHDHVPRNEIVSRYFKRVVISSVVYEFFTCRRNNERSLINYDLSVNVRNVIIVRHVSAKQVKNQCLDLIFIFSRVYNRSRVTHHQILICRKLAFRNHEIQLNVPFSVIRKFAVRCGYRDRSRRQGQFSVMHGQLVKFFHVIAVFIGQTDDRIV